MAQPAGAGAFRFGDALDFAAGSGAWRGLAPYGGSGDFRMLDADADCRFLMDFLAAAPAGLEATA